MKSREETLVGFFAECSRDAGRFWTAARAWPGQDLGLVKARIFHLHPVRKHYRVSMDSAKFLLHEHAWRMRTEPTCVGTQTTGSVSTRQLIKQ